MSYYRICADSRSVLRRLPLFGLASLFDVLAIRRELEGRCGLRVRLGFEYRHLLGL